MIVDKDDGRRRLLDRRLEHLARMNDGRCERSHGNRLQGKDVVFRIQKQHGEVLPALEAKARHDIGSGIRWAVHDCPLLCRLEREAASEFDGGEDRRRLRHAHALDGRKLFRAHLRDGGESALLVEREHLLGDAKHRVVLDARAQEDGEKFRVGKARRALGQKPFARPLVGGQITHEKRHRDRPPLFLQDAPPHEAAVRRRSRTSLRCVRRRRRHAPARHRRPPCPKARP